MLSVCVPQHLSKIQIVAKYEMNMYWLNPTLVDSMFFAYDSFNFAGFSELATDCYDVNQDVIEPPVSLGNWCRLTFPHDDNNSGECWENDFDVNNFTQDIRYKNDNYLENNYIHWDLEFNAYLAPGRTKIFLINDEIWANCNYKFEHDGDIFDFSIEDTLEFWNYFQGFNLSNEIRFSIGECINLSNKKNKNINFDPEINIYPNPFNPNTIISFLYPVNDFTTLSLFNLNGQKVWGKKQHILRGENIIKINSPKYLSSGTYILNMKLGNNNKSEFIYHIK